MAHSFVWKVAAQNILNNNKRRMKKLSSKKDSNLNFIACVPTQKLNVPIPDSGSGHQLFFCDQSWSATKMLGLASWLLYK